MFQVISSLLPVSNLILGENSQKFANYLFKSYNSTANFWIFKLRIFWINRNTQFHKETVEHLKPLEQLAISRQFEATNA